MDLKAFADIVGNLGAPVGFAIILIWHVLKVNKALTTHNNTLVKEVAKLTAKMDALEDIKSRVEAVYLHIGSDTHLKVHVSELAESLDSERKQSQMLLQMLIEAQIRPAEPVPKTPLGLVAPMKVVSGPKSSRLRIKNNTTHLHISFADQNILDEESIREIGDLIIEQLEANNSPRLLLDFSDVHNISSAAL